MNQITDKIKTLHNVSFQNRFIELSELKKIVKDIHLLVLPMDIKSSLNSSAAMMAFSLRRTVICPNIGTVQEYYGQNYMYTYDYQTIEEHVDQIGRYICTLLRNAFDVSTFIKNRLDLTEKLRAFSYIIQAIILLVTCVSMKPHVWYVGIFIIAGFCENKMLYIGTNIFTLYIAVALYQSSMKIRKSDLDD